MLIDTDSRGAMVELGVRLGTGRTAYVVGEGEHIPFTYHSLVVRYADWEAFMSHARTRFKLGVR